jgi:DNA-binding transcriptional regulator YhcF (GntR family)
LKPGQALPSVRELARRLKIHHNTVSHAYQELVRRTWLVRRRGSRVLVRAQAHTPRPSATQGLDELINMTIQAARERGYSLQALRERLRQRMMAEPPDHILVIDQEPGLRRLLKEEIHAGLGWPVEDCAREDLAANGGLAIGALVVTPQYAIEDVKALVPDDRLTIPIAFSAADEHLERIRCLEQAVGDRCGVGQRELPEDRAEPAGTGRGPAALALPVPSSARRSECASRGRCGVLRHDCPTAGRQREGRALSGRRARFTRISEERDGIISARVIESGRRFDGAEQANAVRGGVLP